MNFELIAGLVGLFVLCLAMVTFPYAIMKAQDRDLAREFDHKVATKEDETQ